MTLFCTVYVYFSLPFLTQVEQDFGILFPDAKDGLFLKWPKYQTMILKYAERQVDWHRALNFDGDIQSGKTLGPGLQIVDFQNIYFDCFGDTLGYSILNNKVVLCISARLALGQ